MVRRTNLGFGLYFEKVSMIKSMSYVLPHQSKAIAITLKHGTNVNLLYFWKHLIEKWKSDELPCEFIATSQHLRGYFHS